MKLVDRIIINWRVRPAGSYDVRTQKIDAFNKKNAQVRQNDPKTKITTCLLCVGKP